MGPILHGLIKLQRVENRLRAVKTKLNRCRRAVIFQENQLRTLQSGLEAKEDEIKLTRVQVDRLELELKSRDEHIEKLRGHLNLARTNKEYSALLTELNTAKADDSKLETQVLELMKNIETDTTDCDAIKVQIEAQKGKLEEARRESDVKAVVLEKEIEGIQAEWDAASAEIPAEALRVFKRVADTYDGEAMAVVEGYEEKNGSFNCGGCFMGIPAEVVNVLSINDDIVRCSSCTRILYLPQED